ncbi:MAG TPA: hypothetical protein VFP49_07335 [Nitrososphaeraceae archaeon]|nr:hypothetical protein [Nitrososphaeraceae archaeon]
MDSSKEYNNSKDVRFAVIREKSKYLQIDTYDTGLAVFQPKGIKNNDLKFSIKIVDMDKLKKSMSSYRKVPRECRCCCRIV